MSREDITLTFLIALCGGFVGAYLLRPITRIIGILSSWESYRHLTATELFQYVTGEIVFFGGLIGGIIAVMLFCKKYQISIVSTFDIFAPALALAHGIGRIGCLLGGCCYGIEIQHVNRFAIMYPPQSLSAPYGIYLLATPLIEAILLFLLSALLVVIYLKCKKKGIAASVYLLTYPIIRFVLEFFRGDIIRGSYGIFTTSQYISMAIFLFGAVYLVSTMLEKQVKSNG